MSVLLKLNLTASNFVSFCICALIEELFCFPMEEKLNYIHQR